MQFESESQVPAPLPTRLLPPLQTDIVSAAAFPAADDKVDNVIDVLAVFHYCEDGGSAFSNEGRKWLEGIHR